MIQWASHWQMHSRRAAHAYSLHCILVTIAVPVTLSHQQNGIIISVLVSIRFLETQKPRNQPLLYLDFNTASFLRFVTFPYLVILRVSENGTWIASISKISGYCGAAGELNVAVKMEPNQMHLRPFYIPEGRKDIKGVEAFSNPYNLPLIV